MAKYSGKAHSKHENDTHSRQLDRTQPDYWQSRGYAGFPDKGRR
ncbi:hypothetical protein [Defluviimonas salinarum]|uniref:Uncharacterized protein n=1 Tax=Defluviimonas salinarum TaxID=2992147 RepID=A0ABT3J5L1_9RHOB|nr:hypothetical protein [Defluviimonas salinarum]MCW3782968.1 hypothetical protein [Defluviimonas salinarum]